VSDRLPRRRRFARAAALALTLLAATAPDPASGVARLVRVPVTLDVAFLGRLLAEQVFREADGTARVEAADRCSELVLSEPRLDLLAGSVHIVARAQAQLGLGLGGGCWMLLGWEGDVEVHEEPVLDAALPGVRFRVVDSSLHPHEGGWLGGTGLWEWIKPAVHPRLEALLVDLGPPLAELRTALPPFFGRAEEAALRRLVDSIAIESVRAEPEGLVLGLRLEAPETAPSEAAAGPEAPLTPEELAAFEAATRDWDAFLTFVVKQAGEDALEPGLRSALLEVLLDARHELVDALAAPPSRGEDPVRALFLASWNRLAPLLRDVDSGLPSESALRYLAFVAAGDFLAALDAAGPAFGLEISSDGLRRLARTLAPTRPGDPLQFGSEVDPELRELFGFDAPLPPPQPAAPEGEEENDDEEGEDPEGGPEPSSAPGTTPPEARLRRWLRGTGRLLASLVAAPAHAAGPDAHEALAQRLRRWAPTLADAHEYLPLARDLLDLSAREVRASSGLPEAREDLYRDLVLATAWQESCWRQYVRSGGRLVPLRSRAGAVGLMQVTERVWRGFYDVEGLRWDVGYNVRAGAEILAHYLGDFALRRAGHGTPPRDDELARSSYAMYNGGPSHRDRWRKPTTSASLRAIDTAFYVKFRAIRDGDDLGVARCYAS
jgi:hypothetical protein